MKFRVAARPAGLSLILILLCALALLAPSVAAQTETEGEPAAEGEAQKIAVLELESSGASEVETTAATDRLREELLRTGRFTLVDRSRLDAIVEEQRLQQATCATEECALEVGRILGVSKMVTGRLSKLGPTTWQVSSQLLDVTTAQTERAESVLHEGRLVDLLQVAIPDLAAKLAGDASTEGPPPVVAQAQVPPEPEPEQPEEEPAPPQEAPTRVRVWGGPESFTMNLTLDFAGTEVTEEWSGGGIVVGVEAIVDRNVSLWLATHFGSINSVSIDTDFGSADAENVEGDYSMVAAGVDYVFDNDPWRFLLGGGLFNAAADVTGDFGSSASEFESDASVSGLLLDLRFDYTFESGVLLGAGLNVGAGSASGTETEGADSASGSVVTFFIPVGYTF